MAVFDGDVEIADDTGGVIVGGPKTFTIRNVGTGDLELRAAEFVGVGMTIITDVSDGQVLAPGESASLTVDVTDPVNGGGRLVIPNGDADENPYDFALVPPPGGRIIDDGDAGYSDSGNWFGASGGYERDIRYPPGSGAGSTAVWSFADLLSGQYRVSVSYRHGTLNTAAAAYAVSADGDAFSATVYQRVRASDRYEDGRWWQDLGVIDSAGVVQVVLDDLAAGRVFADAVRIEWIGTSAAASAAMDAFFADDDEETWLDLVR